MRLLGVDLGKVRIGLAVGETTPKTGASRSASSGRTLSVIASPRPALSATGTLRRDASAIFSVGIKEEVDAFVVGLPLEFHADGTRFEGTMARICRRLGAELEKLGATVNYADEAYTSVAAGEALRDAGLTIAEARKRKDGEAACRILEAFAADPHAFLSSPQGISNSTPEAH